MIIGVPREVKNSEYRVGLIPAGARALVRDGHKVLIEAGAGAASGFQDEDYRRAGANIIRSADRLWAEAEMVVKVKEPQPEEYHRLKKGQVLFCYLHLAPVPGLTKILIQSGVNAVAFETIQTDDGRLPCLTPMSEVAGRMSVQVGALYLMRDHGGPGILLSGVPGVPPCEVLIIGGGTAGENAAHVAAGMGAHVRVMEVNPARLACLDHIFAGRVATVMSDEYSIERFVPQADLLIGAVLVPGARAPVIVSEALVKKMRPGSVIVDIAVDQGGCIATTHPTTHEHPTFKKHGVTHYCVANMPGAVPRTSTLALANATLPYALKIAKDGLAKAAALDPAIAKGINLFLPQGKSRGVVTCAEVAKAIGGKCSPLEKLLTGGGSGGRKK